MCQLMHPGPNSQLWQLGWTKFVQKGLGVLTLMGTHKHATGQVKS